MRFVGDIDYNRRYLRYCCQRKDYSMGEYYESSITFSGGNIHYYNCDKASVESVYAPSHGLSGKRHVKICFLIRRLYRTSAPKL